VGIVERDALVPATSPLPTPVSPPPTALPPTLTAPPTFTPAPPSTSIPPSPTWTPTPWPTPAFPAEAAPVSQPLPALPADLYFIREGSLWRWPQAGGDFDLIVAAPEQKSGNHRKLSSPTRGFPPFGVTEYRVTPDGRHLVYVFF